MKEKKFKLPPLGMRIVKSAIGILLCYLVDALRQGQGIVFYSQLAVLWCMQDYVSETKAKAKQRFMGTVIGAIFGLLFLMLKSTISIEYLVQGIGVSLFILIILYTTVLINRKQASYFSCVVFLSIVVNHIADANPYLFVWNRFLDTVIGITLGILVNCFAFPREKNTDILFVSGLDDTLLKKENRMTPYAKVELNRMIENGMQFTISTQRTPASLIGPMKDINLKLPMIVMDGAALFNLEEKKYELVYVISADLSQQILGLIHENEMACFSNVIVDDLLVIYYEETDNVAYNNIIEELRASTYRNYVKRDLPETEDVAYFMLIDKEEKIKKLYENFIENGYGERCKILMYPSVDYEGYFYIKIYNHNASKKNMLGYLKQKLDVDKVITYGTIPGEYTYEIEPGKPDNVVKLIKKEFEPLKRLL